MKKIEIFNEFFLFFFIFYSYPKAKNKKCYSTQIKKRIHGKIENNGTISKIKEKIFYIRTKKEKNEKIYFAN
jgi:hypothetical protein